MHITEPLPNDKRARLVFGLDWRAWPVKGGRAERRRYADDFGATHYVEYKAGTEMIGGFAAPEPGDVRGARLYSGAARIAMHERVKAKPAALVLLQDDQRIHLVYVVRGAVRNDEVLGIEDARDQREKIEQQCLRTNTRLVTLGAGPDIGDVDEPFRASDLLIAKKVGRIAKVPVPIPTMIPVAVIAVAVVVVVTKATDFFAPPPPPPHEPSYTERYMQAVAARFAQRSPKAALLAPLLIAEFRPDDSKRVGWRFDHADCGARGDCSITYAREGGTFEEFDRAAPPSMRPISFDRDGRHLTARGPAVPKAPPVVLAEAKTWPTEQQFIDLLQTPSQRLSVKPDDLDSHGYKVMLDAVGPVLPGPVESGHHGALVMEGKWEIQGFLWQQKLLERLPPNMTLDALTVTFATAGDVGIKFDAKGKYYVLR
ncbi:MAG: hypothetical protein KGQ57_00095 [Burkholderiales bacterium]|nr:hypothetical protein [Burkholderiales bacterium]